MLNLWEGFLENGINPYFNALYASKQTLLTLKILTFLSTQEVLLHIFCM